MSDWKTKIGAFGVAICVVGCNTSGESEPDRDGELPRQRSAAMAAVETAGDEPANPFRADPSEKLLPSERVREIDWDAADGFERMAPNFAPRELESYYASSPVPVLLPEDREALRTVEPTVGRHWYAATFHIDGREVSIEGDRVMREVEGLRRDGKAERTDGGFVVTQVEGVLTLSFTAFNAAYTVDIECAEVNARGTCTNEQFAVDLANRLVRLGGKR